MSITGEHAGKLHQLRRPTFAELYLPKLVTVWREGYGLADLRADVFAGLTVAIVAHAQRCIEASWGSGALC